MQIIAVTLVVAFGLGAVARLVPQKVLARHNIRHANAGIMRETSSLVTPNEDLYKFIGNSVVLHRVVRSAKNKLSSRRLLPQRNKVKSRSRDEFQVKTQIEQENDYALCNSKSNANITRKGQTYAGSKGLSYSEDTGNGKSLICKSKSFKITNKGGNIKRVAAGGTAILSNSPNVDKLLNAQQTNRLQLEVGSSGKSAIGSNASKKEVSAAIKSQGSNAGSSSMSKSRLRPENMETMSDVDGGTDMKGKKGLGMRSVGKEATQIVKNPRTHSRGNRKGDILSQMSHRRKSNFEIEI